MMGKLAVWLARVPHYVLMLAFFVVVFGPKVVADLTGTPWEGFIPWVSEAVTYATGFVLLAKQFGLVVPDAEKKTS